MREVLAIFYADDGMIASRLPVPLQRAMDKLVELFERVGLRTNTKKLQTMICVPGSIRTRLTSQSYTRSREGLHSRRDEARRKVACNICGVKVAAASLDKHLQGQHGAHRPRVLVEELVEEERPARTYKAFQSASGR